MRKEGLRAIHHAPEIDIDHPLDICERHPQEFAAVHHAGIVDHQVHRAEFGDDRVGVGQHRVPVTHIEPIGPDLGAEISCAARRFRQVRSGSTSEIASRAPSVANGGPTPGRFRNRRR